MNFNFNFNSNQNRNGKGFLSWIFPVFSFVLEQVSDVTLVKKLDFLLKEDFQRPDLCLLSFSSLVYIQRPCLIRTVMEEYFTEKVQQCDLLVEVEVIVSEV